MMIGARASFVAAALFGAAAVLLGAFGAHGLVERVSPERLLVWETGAQYQFYHALALLALSSGALRGRWTRWHGLAALGWITGIVVFSGSLYLLVLLDMGWLGAVTPIGGVAFVVGWLMLLGAARSEVEV